MGKRSRKSKSDFPLLDHVDKQMAKLQENVTGALQKFDEEAIHDARVATRRIKAALDLMGPVLSKRHRKPIDRGLKKIRRRLGPLRDADVMLSHLRTLENDRRLATSAHWLGQRLEATRKRLHQEATEEGPSADKSLRRIESWPLVRLEIAEARDGVDHLLAESLHAQVAAFAEQANRLSAQMRTQKTQTAAATTEDGPAESPATRQNPHDVRIAGKALRYTLEMADAEGHSPGHRLMTSFKRMQELLGTWHDHVVLADTALSEVVAAELTHHNPELSDRVIDLARHATKRASQELSTFCRLWDGKGQEILNKICSMFRLTETVDGPCEVSGSDADTSATPSDTADTTLEASPTTFDSGPGDLFDRADETPDTPVAAADGEPVKRSRKDRGRSATTPSAETEAAEPTEPSAV